jgi:atlastin
MDEDPVIISAKDFTPTPSTSPVPIDNESGGVLSAAEVVAAAAAAASTRSSSDNSGSGELSSSKMTVDSNDVDAADGLEIEPAPSACQIVSIGTEADSYAFTFHEEELNCILSKVPAGWKVCVISVVGAFRTGKSFLLSWFLRYLEEHCVRKSNDANKVNVTDDGKKWYERVQILNQHEGSFDWRGGTQRNTTGMWMWSDPYFLSRDNGEEVAILLVDTQGMFDHETTVGLTAAIFGLSTLLSSYQIYNVDKRIQEDNLQQLALFSEYGRMAFEAEEKAAAMGVIEPTEEDEESSTDMGEVEREAEKAAAHRKEPFQKIQFLVRDWQNFDTEDETDIDGMESEMQAYLDHVLAERVASDLKETREQITSCFEEVSCFMMTHPGFAVVKNKYEGDVSKIDSLFLALLDRYCHKVFDCKSLQPKTVRGRELSAVELGTYIKAYAQMFEEIGSHFPKAETMLDATSRANNTNAITASIALYTEKMNKVAGPQSCDYHKPEDLALFHKESRRQALLAFDEMANFGSRKAIEEARDYVLKKLEKDFDVFVSLNSGRNPLLGLETYILPMVIAGVSFILRWVADLTCSGWSQTCKVSSDLLSHVYMAVFFFLVIVGSTKAKQISDLLDRVKAAIQLLTNDGNRNHKKE